MKSNITPKFLFDVSRYHMAGDVDFVICTDARYGFVAQIEHGPHELIGSGAGVVTGRDGNEYIRMCIVRTFGGVGISAKHTELLNEALARYLAIIGKTYNRNKPTDAQIGAFLTAMVRMFQQQLAIGRLHGEEDVSTGEDLIRMIISTRNRFDELRRNEKH